MTPQHCPATQYLLRTAQLRSKYCYRCHDKACMHLELIHLCKPRTHASSCRSTTSTVSTQWWAKAPSHTRQGTCTSAPKPHHTAVVHDTTKEGTQLQMVYMPYRAKACIQGHNRHLQSSLLDFATPVDSQLCIEQHKPTKHKLQPPANGLQGQTHQVGHHTATLHGNNKYSCKKRQEQCHHKPGCACSKGQHHVIPPEPVSMQQRCLCNKQPQPPSCKRATDGAPSSPTANSIFHTAGQLTKQPRETSTFQTAGKQANQQTGHMEMAMEGAVLGLHWVLKHRMLMSMACAADACHDQLLYSALNTNQITGAAHHTVQPIACMCSVSLWSQ